MTISSLSMVFVSLYLYTLPLKKGIMFLTLSLSLSVCVCVSVYHHVCDEMTRPSNTVLSEAITLDNSSILQHYQDDPFTWSGSYGSFIQNHILAYNFKTYGWIHTKFLTLCSLALGTPDTCCGFWDLLINQNFMVI